MIICDHYQQLPISTVTISMKKAILLIAFYTCLGWQQLAIATNPESHEPGLESPVSGQSSENATDQEEDKQPAGNNKKSNPHAHLPRYQITVGAALPPLLIEEYGEVILVNGQEIRYQAWQFDRNLNKVQLIHYLAGRRSASKKQKNFSDQLEALNLDVEKHHVTTIINAADAFIGTSALVASRLDNSKRDYPQISVVGDSTGIGAHTWSLQSKGSAIIIVSAAGKVLFFKQDKFTQQEIDAALALLQKEMQSASTQVN